MVCSTSFGQCHTGVVHENVELPVPVDDGFHDAHPLRFIGDVVLDEKGIAPATAYLLDHERSLGDIHIGHRNVGAFFGESERARASDAERAPGYDR